MLDSKEKILLGAVESPNLSVDDNPKQASLHNVSDYDLPKIQQLQKINVFTSEPSKNIALSRTKVHKQIMKDQRVNDQQVSDKVV